MPRMTTEEIKAIRERAEAATGGNWSTKQSPKDADGWPTCQLIAAVAPRQGIYTDAHGGVAPAANQDFIANARTDIPALLADRESLELEIKQLREQLAMHVELDPSKRREAGYAEGGR